MLWGTNKSSTPGPNTRPRNKDPGRQPYPPSIVRHFILRCTSCRLGSRSLKNRGRSHLCKYKFEASALQQGTDISLRGLPRKDLLRIPITF